jgi:hypothetical protein
MKVSSIILGTRQHNTESHFFFVPQKKEKRKKESHFFFGRRPDTAALSVSFLMWVSSMLLCQSLPSAESTGFAAADSTR